MPMKVKAVYEGGVFRPLEPLDLTEKIPVELTIEPLPQRSVVDETHGLLHIDPETARVIAEDPVHASFPSPSKRPSRSGVVPNSACSR